MTLDLIIISHAKTPELKAITQRGIYSALGNESNVKVYPIVIEGNPNIKYDGCVTYPQTGEFNYNRFLNYGASKGCSEFIAFCNNDLLYGVDWASKLVARMKRESIDSVSPYSEISQRTHKSDLQKYTGIHYGHTVKREFEGWCFVWSRELWNEIKLDERVKFWCSDNATVEQLLAAGKSHAIITDCLIEHPENGGHTLRTVTNRKELTTDQAKIFNQLYDKNVENVGKG